MTYWGQISGNLISLFTFGHIFCQLTDCRAKQWTILFPCKGYFLALKGVIGIHNLNYILYFLLFSLSIQSKRKSPKYFVLFFLSGYIPSPVDWDISRLWMYRCVSDCIMMSRPSPLLGLQTIAHLFIQMQMLKYIPSPLWHVHTARRSEHWT